MSETASLRTTVAEVKLHENLYKRLLWTGTVLDSTVTIAGFALAYAGNTTVGPLITGAALLWFATAVRSVHANKLCATFFQGKPLKVLKAGLTLAWPGLIQLKLFPTEVMQFQEPGEPEIIFGGHDDEELPAGMVRPIRITTGGKSSPENKDVLDARQAITVSFAVQMQIDEPFAYFINFGSIANVRKNLRDICESTVAEHAADKSPAQIIEDLAAINRALRANVQRRFENSGIAIISVRLMSPNLGKTVSAALVKIQDATGESTAMQIKAEGERVDRIKKGEGDASAKLAMLTATADGGKALKTALEVDGTAIIAKEIADGLSKSADTTILGLGNANSDIASMVEVAKSAFGGKKGEK